MPSAFVIRAFDKKTHAAARYKDASGKESITYRETDFENIHTKLIEAALSKTNLTGESTTKEFKDSGNIRLDMFARILAAELVICDITIPNPNVFYELGVRHALRKKGTILIKGQPSADAAPFDLLTDRYLPYSLDEPEKSVEALVEAINATRLGERKVDSPVFLLLPELIEANRESILVVPQEFTEEVERAFAAGSKGWLRLLAEDVKGRSFESVGLRAIGLKQWKLKDLEAAQRNLETIRDEYRDEVVSCLALANVYERRARPTSDVILLTQSNQQAARVLANPRATLKQRVEALALKARNLKTIWRRDFEQLPPAEARQAAANEHLRNSYDAYRGAYTEDLNHFWSGLAAVQMGTIFLDLTAGADETWKASFNSDQEAERYRHQLKDEVGALTAAVKVAIDATIARNENADDVRWARISDADLLFVTGGKDDRVCKRYVDVVPRDDPFAWDAVRGQLQLFASLGFRAALVQRVISEVEMKQNQRDSSEKTTAIMFAGHRVNPRADAPARFPVDRIEEVKACIRERLAAFDKATTIALASAAPGADILFHEVCAELGLESIVCLPVPVDQYAATEFGDLDEWRTRLIQLSQRRRLLELCGRPSLANWLLEPPKVPPANLWERGNRWVLNMALTYGAKNVVLVALWDGKPDRGPGGTEHVVKLARDAGTIDVRIISADDVLGRQPSVTAPPDGLNPPEVRTPV